MCKSLCETFEFCHFEECQRREILIRSIIDKATIGPVLQIILPFMHSYPQIQHQFLSDPTPRLLPHTADSPAKMSRVTLLLAVLPARM